MVRSASKPGAKVALGAAAAASMIASLQVRSAIGESLAVRVRYSEKKGVGTMADQKKVELSVERVGGRLVLQVDPEALVRPGCCSSCNWWVDAAALGSLVLQSAATTPTTGR
jgi:hypothetical protein